MEFKEYLISKGVTEEQAAEIVGGMPEKEFHLTKEEKLDERYAKLKQQKEDVDTQLETANTTIEDLKNSNKSNEDLQTKVTEYEGQIETLKEQSADIQKQSAIEQVFIPNTLDDMKRFFVYVTSQYNEQTEPQIKMAWKQKVKKCYKVSSILFDTDKDFGKLQETYILAQNHILEVDEILERRTKVSRIVYLAPTFVGMIFWLIHFCSNVFGENSIQFEICAILATLAGSFFFDKSDHFL